MNAGYSKPTLKQNIALLAARKNEMCHGDWEELLGVSSVPP
jgi:hypothetical protein